VASGMVNPFRKGRTKGRGSFPAAATVIRLNVGGYHFTTTTATLKSVEGSVLAEKFSGTEEEIATRLPKDEEGRFFVDRDGEYFGVVLNFLRDGMLDKEHMPSVGTREFAKLRHEAEHYKLGDLVDLMDALEDASAASNNLKVGDTSDLELNQIAELQEKLDKRAAEIQARLQKAVRMDPHVKDVLAVQLQHVQLEKDRTSFQARKRGRKLRYNLLIVGVTGTGKSSTLNSLLDEQVCEVSGAQAQGTRGCILRDASIDDDHFLSYIDTQGLGADTSISDTDLLSQIMISTESILKMGIINNILISFDVNARISPPMMANQLTFVELFSELRRSCFLVFTKWNTNSVQVAWNKPLRDWVRRWKRADTEEEITESPPSYEDMYRAFCRYVIDALANEEDGGAFSKTGTLLSFFESRVIFSFNLDAIQVEDRAEGELEPYITVLYHHYRNKALDTLDRGSTRILTEDLTFLRENEATMQSVAAKLIKSRDQKIAYLEEVGRQAKKRKEMKNIFSNMADDTTARIEEHDFETNLSYTTRIAKLAGFVRTVASVGCSIM